MDTLTAITPVQFWPRTANYVRINDVYVHLGSQMADCNVTFLDSGLSAIDSATQRWVMSPALYSGWAQNDQYLINSCLSGLGLVPVSGWLPTS